MLSHARVQSDFANVNFSRDVWDIKKIADDFYILHLTSFFTWKTCTFSSVKGICGLCYIHAMVRRETLFIAKGGI